MTYSVFHDNFQNKTSWFVYFLSVHVHVQKIKIPDDAKYVMSFSLLFSQSLLSLWVLERQTNLNLK